MKQFQILAILGLINLNSQAMLRRPTVFTRILTSKATPSIVSPSPEQTVLHGHALLEHAITQGNTELVRKIINSRWINLSRKDYHNHTLTATEFAQLHGHPEIITLFKKNS